MRWSWNTVSPESNAQQIGRLIQYFMMTHSSEFCLFPTKLWHTVLITCPFISITDGDEPESHKGKHLTSTEKITLVNLIKTLDREYILRDQGTAKDDETNEKRKALWAQIVPAFNEICGINCDLMKLKNTLLRIKRTRKWKAHSVLYDDLVE